MRQEGRISHYSLEEWADFGRGVASPDQRRKLQAHLDEGCRKCGRTLRIWKQVGNLLTADAALPPADDAMRYARALYRMFPPKKSESLIVRLARLEFDSFLEPQPAGVRSEQTTTGRFVLRQGNVVVDLLVDSQAGSDHASLTGQIFDTEDSSALYNERLVSLVHETDEVAHTTTNQFGEFHLGFSPTPELNLVVRLAPDFILVSPLPQYLWQTNS